MKINSYIQDMLAQPAALKKAIENYQSAEVQLLANRFAAGEFSRVILTGMGSSHNSHYPASLAMTNAATPTIYMNTAELLHYAPGLMQPGTLLWINSQSGKSVEIVRYLETVKNKRPAFQLSLTNQPSSILAHAADLALVMHAGEEATVSTKTYLNSVAISLLVAYQLNGLDWQKLRDEMLATIAPMTAFFNDLEAQVEKLNTVSGKLEKTLFLGRGPSMGAIANGSLINTEAAKTMMTGMNVSDFRHGPFEMVDEHLTLFILEGTAKTVSQNHELAIEAHQKGARVIWLAGKPDPVLPTFLMPDVPDSVKPLIEILPFQGMTLLNSQRTGIEPGVFRHIAKVTETE